MRSALFLLEWYTEGTIVNFTMTMVRSVTWFLSLPGNEVFGEVILSALLTSLRTMRSSPR